MTWEYVDGQLLIEWFPGALLLTAAIILALLITRQASLKILEGAPEFRDRERYVRGARWGWLVVLGGFAAVVAAMTLGLGYTVWDLRVTGLAWLTAIFPVAGSVGLLMMPELMGFLVWAQAAWSNLGGREIDWLSYRVFTSRVIIDRSRRWLFAAWLVGSAALTAAPLVTHATVQAEQHEIAGDAGPGTNGHARAQPAPQHRNGV